MEKPIRRQHSIGKSQHRLKRMCRRFCFCLDGRVVPRRSRYHRLGFWAHQARSPPKAGPVLRLGPFCERAFPRRSQWPRISVVVCSYNGSRTIGETLAALEDLDYPNYEIIVVDDGSTDKTSAIAGKPRKVRLIRTENNGLSVARNLGMNAATGEIIAYIDDDAYPDPHWLTYLASGFLPTAHAGIGGPISRRQATARSPIASRMHLEDRFMCCCRTKSLSTFPAATWRSAGTIDGNRGLRSSFPRRRR